MDSDPPHLPVIVKKIILLYKQICVDTGNNTYTVYPLGILIYAYFPRGMFGHSKISLSIVGDGSNTVLKKRKRPDPHQILADPDLDLGNLKLTDPGGSRKMPPKK